MFETLPVAYPLKNKSTPMFLFTLFLKGFYCEIVAMAQDTQLHTV